jgi:thiamine biosynthesis protein ThiS
MLIEVNSAIKPIAVSATVKELPENLGILRDSVAAELNRRMVRRPEWVGTVIKEVDRIEIVQCVGGGQKGRAEIL